MAKLNSRQRRKVNREGNNKNKSEWIKTNTFGDYKEYRYGSNNQAKAAIAHKQLVRQYQSISNRKAGTKTHSLIKKMIKSYNTLVEIMKKQLNN